MSQKIKMGKSHPPLVPHWMVTFSDMRVVLLCFFVLLAGFSEPTRAVTAGRGSLGGYPGLSETSKVDNDSVIEHPNALRGPRPDERLRDRFR